MDGEGEGGGRNKGADGKVVMIEEGSIPLPMGLRLPWRNIVFGTCCEWKARALRGSRLMLTVQTMRALNLFKVDVSWVGIGWQDQTFLDNEMRIVRTNKGNVMVMTRMMDGN